MVTHGDSPPSVSTFIVRAIRCAPDPATRRAIDHQELRSSCVIAVKFLTEIAAQSACRSRAWKNDCSVVHPFRHLRVALNTRSEYPVDNGKALQRSAIDFGKVLLPGVKNTPALANGFSLKIRFRWPGPFATGTQSYPWRSSLMSVSILCDVCFGTHAVAPEQLGSVVQCRYCRATFTADESVQLEVAKSGRTLPELTRYSLSIGKRIGSSLLSVAAVALMLFLCTVSPRSAAESVIASMPARNDTQARTNSRRPPTQTQHTLRPDPPPGAFAYQRIAVPLDVPHFSHRHPGSEEINAMLKNMHQNHTARWAAEQGSHFPSSGPPGIPSSPHEAAHRSAFGTNPFHPGNTHVPRIPISQPPRPQPPTTTHGIRF